MKPPMPILYRIKSDFLGRVFSPTAVLIQRGVLVWLCSVGVLAYAVQSQENRGACVAGLLKSASGDDAAIEALTNNLTPEEYLKLYPERDELPLVEPLYHALSAGDWSFLTKETGLNASSTLQAQLPSLLRAAFALVVSKRISVEQFSTLVILWEAVVGIPNPENLPLIAHPVLDSDGSLKSEAAFALKSTPYSSTGPAPLYSPEFETRIRSLPASERVYWVLQYPKTRIPAYNIRGAAIWEPHPGMDLLNRLIFVSLLRDYCFLGEGVFQIFLPSTGLLWALHQEKYGIDALRPIPQIGISSVESILRQIQGGGRALGLGFPGIELPSAVHTYPTHALGFTYHDFFHLNQVATVPSEVRPVLTEYALSLLNQNPEAQLDPKYIEQVTERVMDGFVPACEGRDAVVWLKSLKRRCADDANQ